MRKQIYPTGNHDENERRVIEKFVYLPISLRFSKDLFPLSGKVNLYGKEEMRWLEKCEIVQMWKFIPWDSGELISTGRWGWVDMAWNE